MSADTETLLRSCALVPREDLARISVTGADRVDYLHRMLTQDIASLRTGDVTYACLLTVRGRILGDMLIVMHDDHLLLELPAAARDAVMGPLERYVIADDVVFQDAPPAARHVLVGPHAADHAPPAALRFDRRGLPMFEISGSADGIDVPRVGGEALDIARVHHGIPAFGPELNDEVLFNEAGLEEAISWTKGCFPGQEPVVMAKHRGHPPRQLVQLALGDARPDPGTALLRDGKSVGQVTSTAPAAADRAAVALAYVKHRLALLDAVFDLAGGGTATLCGVSGVSP